MRWHGYLDNFSDTYLTLYLLITEKISVDLTAIGIMVLLVVSRILTPKEAIGGFANPAVITVGAMFVVSKGMMRTGGVEFLGRKIIKIARGNYKLALIIILLSVALPRPLSITRRWSSFSSRWS